MALVCIGNCVAPRLMRAILSTSMNPTHGAKMTRWQGCWGRNNGGSFAENGKTCGLVLLSALWRLSRPGVDLRELAARRRAARIEATYDDHVSCWTNGALGA
eukprot:1779497-Pyramimonas_sp.AAC.1